MFSFTERTDAEVRGLVSASGDIAYNNTTGVFTYTPPVIPTDLSDLTDNDGLLEPVEFILPTCLLNPDFDYKRLKRLVTNTKLFFCVHNI